MYKTLRDLIDHDDATIDRFKDDYAESHYDDDDTIDAIHAKAEYDAELARLQHIRDYHASWKPSRFSDDVILVALNRSFDGFHLPDAVASSLGFDPADYPRDIWARSDARLIEALLAHHGPSGSTIRIARLKTNALSLAAFEITDYDGMESIRYAEQPEYDFIPWTARS